jgi:hypothetical protein
MHIEQAPLVVALAASVALLFRVRGRLFPVIALAGSAFKVPVIGTALLFGGAMMIGGIGSWMKSTSKVPVTAATVVTLIGLMRVLARYL